MSNHFDNYNLPNNLNDTFSYSDNSNSFNSVNQYHYNPNDSNSSSSSNIKETGIIEKMLVSYGFIQCCERQARLFFHFSQYLGNTDHLKIGDPVEYETSYDRRTGKPVAINIKKITSDDFMTKLSKTERLTGVIATELTNNREGRIAFENMGEFFFLPFTQEDVIGTAIPKANDKVSFILTADDSGNYRAISVQLEAPSLSNQQGIISAIKDTFGFIEKTDMSKIFFHSSDCNDFKALNVGDLVEFNVTTRKNKELATSVVKVANTDEEISERVHKGRITKYNSGRINLASGVIHCPELNKEFLFYDKDVKGNFTVNVYDIVDFQIATDRRNQHQRAVNLTFLAETFNYNNEERQKGYVASLKELYGFIKCPSIEGSLIYFKLSELLDSNLMLKLNDEVEFTYIVDVQNKKHQAIRISLLPNGTVFNMLPPKRISENQEDYAYPLINFDFGDDTPLDKGINGNGDNFANNWNNTKELVDLLEKTDISDTDASPANFDFLDDAKEVTNGIAAKNVSGIIVFLKDNFGFIESIDGENEYYFHISHYNDENNRRLGQPVVFNTLLANGKWKASEVRSKPSVTRWEGQLSEYQTGVVLRTIQMFDTEQKDYIGLIAKVDGPTDLNQAWNAPEKYEFSMISCKFLMDYISIGDTVKFQIGTNIVTKKKRAYNVEVLRERTTGTINVIHRMYGFITPDVLQTTYSIYFNGAEIKNGSKLRVGDKVDFYFIKNKKIDKCYAIDVNKMMDLQVSTTDLSMLKNLMKPLENGPKVIVIRQPRAPDGTRGFRADDRH